MVNTWFDTRIIRDPEAVPSPLRQIYSALTAACDTYIQLMDLPSESQGLLRYLIPDRHRIDLWRRILLAQDQNEQGNLPTDDIGSWTLFNCITPRLLESLLENRHKLEGYVTHTNMASQEGHSAFLKPSEYNHEESELPKSMSTTTKLPLEHSLMKLPKTSNYAIPEHKRIKRSLQTIFHTLICFALALEKNQFRRRLRTHFIAELPVRASLKHQDIERVADTRSVIEQEQSLEYLLAVDDIVWQKSSSQNRRPRGMATWRGESVIVDWQNYLDGRWRREDPAAFRRQTQNLITILNDGLRPLNLSVLHCVGYLDMNSNITGYVFRLPPGPEPGQDPVTLHHLLCNVQKTDYIPSLGERFQLANSLVSTVFEIHNLGWVHKNIHPENILFWPKSNSKDKVDICKPYLIGFHSSRPIQQGFSVKPLSQPGDDLYRHPLYKGAERQSFQPSFDMYSLGVVLYEIGVWRCAAVASQEATKIPRAPQTPPDSNLQYIDNLTESVSAGEIESLMGVTYRNAVMACLKREFDELWEMCEGDLQKQLHTYLEEVQNKVVGPIGVCKI